MGRTNNREKIAWLKRYNILDRRIQARFNECERLRSVLGKITATLSDMPGGGGSIHKSFDHDTINRIIDLIGEMEQDCNDWVDARLEIKAAIDRMDSALEKELLEKRYLNGWGWIKVCSEMNYEWAQTHRIHGRALQNIRIDVIRQEAKA